MNVYVFFLYQSVDHLSDVIIGWWNLRPDRLQYKHVAARLNACAIYRFLRANYHTR